jgi:hypothetical protein
MSFERARWSSRRGQHRGQRWAKNRRWPWPTRSSQGSVRPTRSSSVRPMAEARTEAAFDRVWRRPVLPRPAGHPARRPPLAGPVSDTRGERDDVLRGSRRQLLGASQGPARRGGPEIRRPLPGTRPAPLPGGPGVNRPGPTLRRPRRPALIGSGSPAPFAAPGGWWLQEQSGMRPERRPCSETAIFIRINRKIALCLPAVARSGHFCEFCERIKRFDNSGSSVGIADHHLVSIPGPSR